jgi:hypothetical protein
MGKTGYRAGQIRSHIRKGIGKKLNEISGVSMERFCTALYETIFMKEGRVWWQNIKSVG